MNTNKLVELRTNHRNDRLVETKLWDAETFLPASYKVKMDILVQEVCIDNAKVKKKSAAGDGPGPGIDSGEKVPEPRVHWSLKVTKFLQEDKLENR